MALYRKYRPATFAEVVGQEHVTDPLSTALDTGRISHAYLFSGPRGCGKTSSARILARSLNCVEGPTSRPCGTCASCVALGPGGSGNLDVIELDAASHGGVDDTRELRDRAFYAPAESRYRVFIVDEAHMVTTAGFNALLKIVEEPPAHLIFIFATTEPDKVLPTIRSRTHHYPFRLLPPATMRGLLGKICEQEHVPVEEAVYPLVIRAGGGSPRDSLSVLDQLLAGAGPEGVTYPRAVSLLGVTDVALIDHAVDALAADDGAALFGTIDQVMEAGHDPRRFAVDLLERLRDLILLRAVPDAAERGLVAGPGDVLERMRDQAARIGPATLTRYAELLHEGLGEMRGATAPRLLLEVICARMLLPSVSDTESATLQRLERLERGFATGAIPSARPAGDAPARPPADAPGPASSSAQGSSAEGRRRGAEILAAAMAEKEAAARKSGVSGAEDTTAETPGASGAAEARAHTSDGPAADRGPHPYAPVADRDAADNGRVPPSPAPSAEPIGRPSTAHSAAAPPAATQSSVTDSTTTPSVAAHSAAPPSSAPDAVTPASRGDEHGPATQSQPPSSAAPVSDAQDVVPNPPTSTESDSATGSVGSAPAPDTRRDGPEVPSPQGDSRGRMGHEPGEASPRVDSQSGPAYVGGAPQGDHARRADSPSGPAHVGGATEGDSHAGAGAEPVAEARRADAPSTSVPAGAASGATDRPGSPQGQAPSEDLLGLVDAAWADIKTKVREFGLTLHALMSGAAVSRVEGQTVVFAHQSAPLAQRLSDPRNIESVRAAVRAVLGRELDVRWETGAPAARPAPQAKNTAGPAESKPAARPQFSRPSQAKGGRARTGKPDDDIPPPDFPDLPDDPGPQDSYAVDPAHSGGESAGAPRPAPGIPAPPTPEEEQEMLAAAAVPVAPGDRQDPDEVALALLRSELGAKSLDG
ncbi:DNA polymerase III subunit gamma and tau [Nocardia coubleae]|uniref:DNA polymerase III subunit gamma/tau n=1 Tax=Nocardia coubleae TaxID=356147 RepID=A0A846W974_9NOCA|nr:DNA polymerase III subunit gamma and tau [Nocardia coubleae]NKX89256.1 DNA polymerase III subunit gamma and tau [Nocardia coubleae]